jgi:hypothetical protein
MRRENTVSAGSQLSATTTPTIEDMLHRVIAEYREMPGLTLTVEQVGRLCGIEQALCRRVLDALVSATILSVTPRAYYVLATDGPRIRPAKADLSVQEHSAKAS